MESKDTTYVEKPFRPIKSGVILGMGSIKDVMRVRSRIVKSLKTIMKQDRQTTANDQAIQ